MTENTTKLFEVTNGYMGEVYVYILVLAKNEKDALELARNQFKLEWENFKTYDGKSHRYGTDYYENLECEMLLDGIAEFVTTTRGG